MENTSNNAPRENKHVNTKTEAIKVKTRDICRNWKRLGRCDYGDRCKFIHDNSAPFTPEPHVPGAQTEAEPKASSQAKPASVPSVDSTPPSAGSGGGSNDRARLDKKMVK